jgi:tripartite-type tricarboxylate transporter receptor subunit TctC
MQADVARLGGVLDIGTPQDFEKFIARESQRWRDVVEKGHMEKQ